MKNWMIWIPITALCMLAGCATTQTGETIMTPETVEAIDAVAAVAEPLGISLGILFPSFAAFGGVLAGIAGAWRKMKPELSQARGQAHLATLAGQATSVAIEEFKKNHPDEWGTLSDFLEKHHGTTTDNFYRALRGLPPKD